jgi:hypothetical protein
MIVTELQIYEQLDQFFTPYAPFTASAIVGEHTTATYWTSTFGALGDSTNQIKTINAVLLNSDIFLSKTDTLANCVNTPQSFFYDFGTQTLYIHYPHDLALPNVTIQAGVAIGATNGDVVLIGNQQYNPILRQVPNVQSKQDPLKYSKLAFVSGKVVFSNVGGEFDDIIQAPIYGNEINQYYLPNGKQEYERSELIPIASYYVEDYDFTLTEFSVNVQDKRKSQNSKILQLNTVPGDPVPLIYGQVRVAKALIDEADGTTGNVTYRVAEELTNFGTVQSWNDTTKKWVNVTPVSTDNATGRFVVSAANGRQGGASDGTPLQFRLLEPTGIVPAKPTDIIKDLNLRVLNIAYNTSNYNQTEWAASTTDLYTIGIVFDRNIELFEAVRIIQGGSYPGFRYEIDAEGKRTAIIDDWDKAAIKNVSWYDIKDNMTLSVSTDSKNFAAVVRLKYDKDWNEGKFLTVTNTDYQVEAQNKYRQSPTSEWESFLVSQADAEDMAEWLAFRLSEIRGIVKIELHGQEYYTLRIYDILNIDLCTEDRRYFGTWKAQVLSVYPKFDGLSNQITAVLIEQLEC